MNAAITLILVGYNRRNFPAIGRSPQGGEECALLPKTDDAKAMESVGGSFVFSDTPRLQYGGRTGL